MRLLPKSSGVRPIINMARRRRDPLENVSCFVNKFICFDVVVYFFLQHLCNQVSGRPARPVNQELQDLFSVLNYEKVRMIVGWGGVSINVGCGCRGDGFCYVELQRETYEKFGFWFE